MTGVPQRLPRSFATMWLRSSTTGTEPTDAATSIVRMAASSGATCGCQLNALPAPEPLPVSEPKSMHNDPRHFSMAITDTVPSTKLVT